MLYSTYLGGSGIYDPDGPRYERASGIALDPAGNPYVTGVTYSNDFPVTPGAFETAPGNGGETFLTKFGASLMKQLPVPTVNVTANANPQTAGVPVVFTAQVVSASGGSTPTGTVSFSIDEEVNVISTGGYPSIGQLQTVNLDGSGTATLTTTAIGGESEEPNMIIVYYSGDANNAPSSGFTTETITPGSGNLPVAISVTPNANPAPYGSTVTFGISVKDPSGKGVPDGDVYILDNSAFAGEAILDPTGEATITDNYLVAGAHNLAIWFSTFNGNYASSSVPYLENVTPLGVIPAPVLSLAAGTYSSGQSVTITDAASPDARIVYTINGSVPSSLNGSIYSGPISVAQSETQCCGFREWLHQQSGDFRHLQHTSATADH